MTTAMIVASCVTGACLLGLAFYLVYWRGYFAGARHVLDALREDL